MDFNGPVIEEFRANHGVVGGMFAGARLLLLTTTGARTGIEHTVPLGYLPDGAERVLVIGSAGGSPRNPAWFHNVLADPRVRVEAGVFRYPADAVVLVGAERDEAFARAVADDPGWGDYQEKSGRLLPVVALVDVSTGPPDVAAPSPGAALRLIHDGFRRELALVRAEVVASGPGLGAQLRVNCLSLCQGLELHHRGEDLGIFAAVVSFRPDLTYAVEQMRIEHERVAALLDELRALLAADAPDRAALLAEIDRLTGELEEHLRFEEEQLIPVLDGATAGPRG